MKWLLTLVCVTCLIGVSLYPLLTLGLDRPLNWLLQLGLCVGGGGSLYLLIRLRKSL